MQRILTGRPLHRLTLSHIHTLRIHYAHAAANPNWRTMDIPILACIFFTFNWLTLTSEMHFVKFHPEVASCLLSRGKRKYAPLGMELLWKYIRNCFLVYQLTLHFFVISPKLQWIWSWNFEFCNWKNMGFHLMSKMYYFRLSPGGWECDQHKVLKIRESSERDLF